MPDRKNPGSKKVNAARELLGLPKLATLSEIRRAYRNKCRLWHPDVEGPQSAQDKNTMMQAINEAYQILLAYCQNYHFCLAPEEEKTDEDWWMERFGYDAFLNKEKPPE